MSAPESPLQPRNSQELSSTKTAPDAPAEGHAFGVGINEHGPYLSAGYNIPFAPASFVQTVETVCPGYGQRVLDYTIDEQKNRHAIQHRQEDRADAIERRKDRDLELKAAANDAEGRRRAALMGRGQMCAFIIALAGIGGTVYLISLGTTAGLLGGTLLGGANMLVITMAFLNPQNKPELAAEKPKRPRPTKSKPEGNKTDSGRAGNGD